MKLNEIVQEAREANPKQFRDVPEQRATQLVMATLREIAKQLQATTEGKVSVAGFGLFNVRQVERVKDGKKEKIKRIFFRPTDPNRVKKAPRKEKAV